MKRLLQLSVLLILAMSASARSIDYSAAKKMAVTFLSNEKGKSIEVKDVSLPSEVKNRLSINSVNQAAYYLFNSEDDKGFVIISADDQVLPILGYSATSSFKADSELPPALQDYLAFCTEYINDVREGLTQSNPQPYRPLLTATPIVEPLCSAEWGQGRPYNNLCPMDKKYNVQCPVGCVATAMAQIMYKWKWPESGRGSVSYMSNAGPVKINYAESIYEWDKMTDRGNGNEEASAAVSKLCYDLAVSLRMMFDAYGSGSYAEYAYRSFVTNLYYCGSKLKLEYRDCIADTERWNRHIKEDLDAGRPLLCCASDAGGAGGHAFVLDGYDADFNIHINWGWDGEYNGYFPLTTLDIEGLYEFSQMQHIIRGIYPDYEKNDLTRQQMQVYMEEAPTVNKKQIALTDSFTVTAHHFYNMTVQKEINVMVGLCNMDGEVVEELCTITNNLDDFMLEYGTGYSYYDFDVIFSKDSYPEEYYTIRIFFQEKKKTTWVLPMVVGGEHLNNIYVQIKDGKATFGVRPTAIESIVMDKQKADNEIYTLGGQKIAKPQNGLNIINGKKVFVR